MKTQYASDPHLEFLENTRFLRTNRIDFWIYGHRALQTPYSNRLRKYAILG